MQHLTTIFAPACDTARGTFQPIRVPAIADYLDRRTKFAQRPSKPTRSPFASCSVLRLCASSSRADHERAIEVDTLGPAQRLIQAARRPREMVVLLVRLVETGVDPGLGEIRRRHRPVADYRRSR